MSGAEIDPNSIPKRLLTWPAAFRLRPIAVPQNPYAAAVAGDEADIEALIAHCSSVGRHNRGLVPLPFLSDFAAPETVLAAFANPAPEWQFAPTGLPHLAVAENAKAAIRMGKETFGQFLKDTDEGPCRVSFVLERFVLKGSFHEITDAEVFSRCYDAVDYTVSHQLVSALRAAEADGLIYARNEGNCAVVLKADCFSGYARERALALDWDGIRFTRYFDYRDLYWAELTG